jgi:hypothetical protein
LSAWYATDLDFLLRNLRAATIVINGTFTDYYVLNAAFEGSNLGYHVVMPRDLRWIKSRHGGCSVENNVRVYRSCRRQRRPAEKLVANWQKVESSSLSVTRRHR